MSKHWSEDYKTMNEHLKSRAKINKNGCWEWMGAIDPKTGYGVIGFRIDGKLITTKPHILAACVYHGVPFSKRPNKRGTKITASHLCHNKACCNPGHLRFESQKNNFSRSKDKYTEALHKYHDKTRRVKFKTIVKMVKLEAKGYSQYEIGKFTGFDQSYVSRILRGIHFPEQVELARRVING